jgi:uncharacterized membrane protein
LWPPGEALLRKRDFAAVACSVERARAAGDAAAQDPTQEEPMVIRQIQAPPSHEALRDHMRERAESVQNRIADTITTFAGSMVFVYLHVALFAVWMLVFEASPWPTLTLAVSLEAIFLSTFVMISQNRADARRQVFADEQWRFVQEEEQQNEQLIAMSQEILDLTKEIRATAARLGDGGTAPNGG